MASIRSLASSLLSALMVVTLLWGGCTSCPKFFMFPSAVKDCCKAGKCERPTQTAPLKECKRMPLDHQAYAPHVELAPAAGLAAQLPPAVLAVALPPAPGALPVEHSPPDLTLLNSIFLI